MRHCTIHVLETLLMVVVCFTSFSACPATASGWKLVRNADDIKVYTRPVRGSEFDAFKATTKIRTSLENLLAIMADTSTNCEWMHQCGKPAVLKQVTIANSYIYQVKYFPAPFHDRDVIIHYVAVVNKRGDEVMIRLKAAPGFCDQNRIPTCHDLDQRSTSRKFVRITKAQGYYRLRKLSDGLVEFTWQMHTEPGGSVTSWMSNLKIVEIPFETLRGLRRIVTREWNTKIRLKLAPNKP